MNLKGRNLTIRPNSYLFSIVSESKVLKYLNSQVILSRFVRDCASIIACPLTHVINLSLIQGVVPDDLKSAREVPLFKKSDKTDVCNYRPLSILTNIFKVFERVGYDQVESYLDQKKLLYKFQSGFRSRFSTDPFNIFYYISNGPGSFCLHVSVRPIKSA